MKMAVAHTVQRPSSFFIYIETYSDCDTYIAEEMRALQKDEYSLNILQSSKQYTFQ